MGESNCSWNRKFNLNTDLLISTQSIYQGNFVLLFKFQALNSKIFKITKFTRNVRQR